MAVVSSASFFRILDFSIGYIRINISPLIISHFLRPSNHYLAKPFIDTAIFIYAIFTRYGIRTHAAYVEGRYTNQLY